MIESKLNFLSLDEIDILERFYYIDNLKVTSIVSEWGKKAYRITERIEGRTFKVKESGSKELAVKYYNKRFGVISPMDCITKQLENHYQQSA